MSLVPRRKSTKVPTEAEFESCSERGYDLSSIYLGGGAMGRVFLATPGPKAAKENIKMQMFMSLFPSRKVAIKIIYVDMGAGKLKSYVDELSREVANMNIMFGYENILLLLDVFIGCKRVYLVTEYASGGSLKQVYRSIVGRGKNKVVMPEGLSRYYFKELVLAVSYLHEKKIAHRDLKLDNILVTDSGRIKLADFGFSVKVFEDDFTELACELTNESYSRTFCGTPAFMAPEVLRCSGSYRALCADVWSLGVILFVLTNSKYPFSGDKMKHVLRDIKKKGKDLPYFDDISKDCQDLVRKMLQYKPPKRLTVSEILKHPWLHKPSMLPPNYKTDQVKIDHEVLEKIRTNSRFKLEAAFVRSYLLQRAKLLRIYKNKLRKKKSLPSKIQKEFGLPIAIPRREGVKDPLQIEVWRIMSTSIRSSSADSVEKSSASSINGQLAVSPRYNLSMSCKWVSDGFGSTVGVSRVKRTMKEVSTLERWSRYRNDNKPPLTELERCIQLFNTVDMDVKRKWPLSHSIPRPRHAYFKLTKSLMQPNEERSTKIKEIDGVKMFLKPLENDYVDCNFLFVRYHPRIDDAQAMDWGDFEKAEKKFLSVEATTAKSDAITSENLLSSPSNEQEELISQISSFLNTIVKKPIISLQTDNTSARSHFARFRTFKSPEDSSKTASLRSDLSALPNDKLSRSSSRVDIEENTETAITSSSSSSDDDTQPVTTIKTKTIKTYSVVTKPPSKRRTVIRVANRRALREKVVNMEKKERTTARKKLIQNTSKLQLISSVKNAKNVSATPKKLPITPNSSERLKIVEINKPAITLVKTAVMKRNSNIVELNELETGKKITATNLLSNYARLKQIFASNQTTYKRKSDVAWKHEFQIEKTAFGQISSVSKITTSVLERKESENTSNVNKKTEGEVEDFIMRKRAQIISKKTSSITDSKIEMNTATKDENNCQVLAKNPHFFPLCHKTNATKTMVLHDRVVTSLVKICQKLQKVEDSLTKIGPIKQEEKNEILVLALAKWRKGKNSEENLILSKLLELLIERNKPNGEEHQSNNLPTTSNQALKKSIDIPLGKNPVMKSTKCENFASQHFFKPSNTTSKDVNKKNQTNIKQEKKLQINAKLLQTQVHSYESKTDKNKMETSSPHKKDDSKILVEAAVGKKQDENKKLSNSKQKEVTKISTKKKKKKSFFRYLCCFC